MCGICGFAGFEDKGLIERMSATMVHRGPDEYGFYFDKNITLAHRRLSIIDLATGKQPIYNEDKTICVVYNGEIYNYKEIRKGLEAKGHSFCTNSDTEVIVHLYEEMKEDCVNEFNGEFAFALWDSRFQKLILARDRFGIKPLYYSIINGNLIFASEIKSILRCDKIARDIDYYALDHYITLRYTAGEETLFERIRKLSPGTILIYDRNKNIEQKRYWILKIGLPEKLEEEDYIYRFKYLLGDSVKLRLNCDVPFGAFLSGGLDSSSIVAMMSKYLNAPIKTFSIGFGTKKDEFLYARRVSRYLNTDHREEIVKEEDFKLMPEIVRHLDDPIGDAIIVPVYRLAQMARERVKMVFSGEGADELFGSYIHQHTMYLGDIYNRFLPDMFKFGVFPKAIELTPLFIIEKLFNYPASLGRKGKSRLIEFLSYINDKSRSYLALVSLFNQEDKECLYTGNFKERLRSSEDTLFTGIRSRLENKEIGDFYNRMLLNEFSNWLPNNVLFKQDKLTMANSLEARVPFLDHRLVEFEFSLPKKLRVGWGKGKFMLRKAMNGELPAGILGRKKQAFFIPMDRRFKDIIMNMTNEFLSESAVRKRNLFNYSYIKEIFSNIEYSPFVFTKQLVSLVILEIWFRINIDKEYNF